MAADYTFEVSGDIVEMLSKAALKGYSKGASDAVEAVRELFELAKTDEVFDVALFDAALQDVELQVEMLEAEQS